MAQTARSRRETRGPAGRCARRPKTVRSASASYQCSTCHSQVCDSRPTLGSDRQRGTAARSTGGTGGPLLYTVQLYRAHHAKSSRYRATTTSTEPVPGAGEASRVASSSLPLTRDVRSSSVRVAPTAPWPPVLALPAAAASPADRPSPADSPSSAAHSPTSTGSTEWARAAIARRSARPTKATGAVKDGAEWRAC
eukprot:1469967-Prymnesium_polylepis.3